MAYIGGASSDKYIGTKPTTGGVSAAAADADAGGGGGGGGSIELVATGAIANGDVVGVTVDGKVKTTSIKMSSSGTKFSLSGTVNFTRTVYIPTIDKVLVVYTESNVLYGAIGTVSGASITYTTPYQITPATIYDVSACYDSANDKVVVVYHNSSVTAVRAKVLTVTATTISAGSALNIQQNGSTPNETGCVFDSTNNKVIAFWNWGTTSTAAVLTVSGTSLSKGSDVNWRTGTATDNPQADFDSTNGKALFVYQVSGGVSSKVATVSGTSISFGSEVLVASSTSYGPTATFDSANDKMIVTWRKNDKRKAVAGTISGTSITYGTEIDVDSSSTSPEGSAASTFNTDTESVSVVYMDNKTGSTRTYLTDFKITSGTTLEVVTQPTQVDPNTAGSYWSLAYDPDQRLTIISGRGDGNQGRGYVYDGTSVIDSYMGLAAEAISDTATGEVTVIGGVNESQSGLSIGYTYYLQADGTLGIEETTKKMGVALSATKLLIG